MRKTISTKPWPGSESASTKECARGDYGPYKQSERRDIYRRHVKMLLDEGKAYIAFDTPEELEQARASRPNFQYDASTRTSMRNSLTMSKDEVERLIAEGTPMWCVSS